MPKLEFTQEEITAYVKRKIESPLYKDTVAIADSMLVHADGLIPEKLLYERRPNEPMEVMEYRKKIFSAKTKPVFSKVYTSLQKIRRSADWNIRYEGEFNRIAEGETLEDYMETKFPGFTSVTNWAFQILLRKYLIDPNAVCLVYPKTLAVPENEYLQPIAQIFDSADVVDFVEDDFAVMFQPKGAVFFVRGKAERGQRWWFVTRSKVIIYDQVSSKLEFQVIEEYNIEFDEFPCFQLKGVMVEQLHDQYLYESKIGAMIPELDEAVREYSDLQAAKVLHIYPERWEYTNHECTTCKGKGLRPNPLWTASCNCEASIACESCNGRGYIVAGPYSKIMIKPNATGEQPLPTPPAGYVEKDVEIVKLMEEGVEAHITNALAAINFEFLAKSPLAQSGVAKEVDKDELNNTVHSIAEDIVACLDNIYWITALYRYNTLYSKGEIEMMVPDIAVPERFDILSSTHALEDLKTLKETKANPVLQSAAELEYASSRFSTNPEVHNEVHLILVLDPLPNITEDDKMSRLSNRGITEITYIISSNIQEFVRRAIEENAGFPELDVKLQREKMAQYAQDVLDSLAPLPDPDTSLDDADNDQPDTGND